LLLHFRMFSQYSPTSPAYSPTSPAYSPTSPQVGVPPDAIRNRRNSSGSILTLFVTLVLSDESSIQPDITSLLSNEPSGEHLSIFQLARNESKLSLPFISHQLDSILSVLADKSSL
jgi:RNA polymerase Rpb1 C-terminal repeat